MSLPSSLLSLAEHRLQELTYRDHIQSWPETFKTQLMIALGCSDFLHEAFEQDEYLCQHFPRLFEVECRGEQYRELLQAQLVKCTDENSLMRELRYFRRREMSYIAWLDFNLAHNEISNWSLEQS